MVTFNIKNIYDIPYYIYKLFSFERTSKIKMLALLERTTVNKVLL